MTRTNTRRTLELSFDFDRYIINHPDMLDEVPKRAYIFLTMKGYPEYNAQTYTMVEKARKKGKQLVEVRKEGRVWKVIKG